MPRAEPLQWFEEKRPWSVYKDLILGYYLKPYLAKVKRLRRPVALFDMFAGPGRFRSGEPGSPIIMAESLLPLAEAAYPVEAHFVEKNGRLATELRRNLGEFSFAHVHEADCFDLVDRITEVAKCSTTFLYLDPLNVTGLYFDRLVEIYDALKSGVSVEVLLILMAPAFMREAASALVNECRAAGQDYATQELFPSLEDIDREEIVGLAEDDSSASIEAQVQKLDRIAGGNYWKAIAERRGLGFSQKCESLVCRYRERMAEWFQLTASYPIVDESSPHLPKYWMVFGSRYMPAVDLFNRAACKARREQGVAWKTEDSLFGAIEIDTSADRSRVDAVVNDYARRLSPVKWDALRWAISVDMTGLFTDSELDAGIKRALSQGRLRGASGGRVERNAILRFRNSR